MDSNPKTVQMFGLTQCKNSLQSGQVTSFRRVKRTRNKSPCHYLRWYSWSVLWCSWIIQSRRV